MFNVNFNVDYITNKGIRTRSRLTHRATPPEMAQAMANTLIRLDTTSERIQKRKAFIRILSSKRPRIAAFRFVEEIANRRLKEAFQDLRLGLVEKVKRTQLKENKVMSYPLSILRGTFRKQQRRNL